MPFGAFPGTIATIAEYNLLGQVLGAALGPLATEITLQLNAKTMLNPLSPADLALAVIRNELGEADAAGEAALSGLNAERFHTLTRLTGDAPPPDAMAAGLRRGFVDDPTYLRGIRQGRLRDEWAELTKKLATADPSPITALLADLKAQLPTDEARRLYGVFGGNPEHYDLAFHVEGAAPSPLEAAEAARRGVAPWEGTGPESISFEQVVRESAYRNKYLPVFRALSEYLPPPRTTTAMLREGALTREQAKALFEKAGLPPELVTAYLNAASQQKQARHKELAESTVVELYRDRLVNAADATTMLEALSYTADEAAFILRIEDMRLAQHYLGLAIGRIHSLYVGHRLERAAAVSVLARLGVDAAGVSDLMGLWDWERVANVKPLTPAEVGRAYKLSIITEAAALAELGHLGYTPHDAWLYLSIVHGSALDGEPPADAALPAPGA